MVSMLRDLNLSLDPIASNGPRCDASRGGFRVRTRNEEVKEYLRMYNTAEGPG